MRVTYLGPSDEIRAKEDDKPTPKGGSLELSADAVRLLREHGHLFDDDLAAGKKVGTAAAAEATEGGKK